jgi:hypothetical protein
MDSLQWFKIQVIYPVTSGLNHDEDEDSELRRIRLKQIDSDGYERDYAYLNLSEDPIANILPSCFAPKDRQNKVYISELIMQSGNVITAVGKPESIYNALLEYVNSLPEPKES